MVSDVFMFNPYLGMIASDSYLSSGLKTPTRVERLTYYIMYFPAKRLGSENRQLCRSVSACWQTAS